MKPTEYLKAIQKCIGDREPTVETPFTVAIREGNLLCLKSKNLKASDTVIIACNHINVSQGFSAYEWEKLFKKMSNYFSRSK